MVLKRYTVHKFVSRSNGSYKNGGIYVENSFRNDNFFAINAIYFYTGSNFTKKRYNKLADDINNGLRIGENGHSERYGFHGERHKI